MFLFIKPKLFYATPFLARVSIGFVLAAVFCYFFVDFPLIEEIAPYRKIFRTPLKLASFLIFPPLYLFIGAGAFIWARFLCKNKQWTLPSFEMITAQALSVAFVRVFKVIIGRARPESFLSRDLIGFEFFSSSHHFHSLPSGHTMAAFTLAASIALLFPRFRYLSLTLAFLFSLSRIYLLDHFPSDLFATGAIGIFIAQMVHIVLQKITDRNHERQFNGKTFAPRNS